MDFDPKGTISEVRVHAGLSHLSESDENAIDCEIACDCAKRANVVLHLGLCKENFDRKHTVAHKPTSAQPVIVTKMTHTH